MISLEIVPSSFRNALPMSRKCTFEPSSSLAIFSLTDFSRSRIGRRLLAPGENAEQQDLGLGQPLAQLMHDGGDSLGDLVGRAAAGVVGADHQHDDLGLDALELAVLNPPEDVLGPVAADAEVGRLARAVEPLPRFLGAVPALGDRVAQEEQVDVPLLGLLQKRLVHIHPGPVARLGDDRRRALGMQAEHRRPPGREEPSAGTPGASQYGAC